MQTVELSDTTIRLRRSGEGPPVVFCTDPPNVLEHCSALVARLKPHAHVIVFEPPGFGQSRARRSYRHGVDDMARVTIELLDKLELTRAVLAFPCLSGFAAARVAQMRPDLVSGIALSQTPSWDEAQAWLARVDRRRLLRVPFLSQAAMRLWPDGVVRRWYAAATARPEQAAHLTMMAIECMDHGARFPLASALQAFARGEAPGAVPAACPVLAFWGPYDRSHRQTPPESVRALAPHAELVRMQTCGHFPELEDPAGYADALVAWMARTRH